MKNRGYLALISGALLVGCASSNTESAGNPEENASVVDVCQCVEDMTTVVQEVEAMAQDSWGFNDWVEAMESNQLPCVKAGLEDLGSKLWTESMKDCPGYLAYVEAVNGFRDTLVSLKASEGTASEQHVMQTPEGGSSALLDQLSGKNQD